MAAYLALEDGTVFKGVSFGAEGFAEGELVFNTSLSGYQEILTDPSYRGQIVLMTYPLIGNYGINSIDVESSRPFVEAFVVKECSRIPSNWRSSMGLREYLKEHGIPGIEGIDTRALTKHIREKGAMMAVISTAADADPAYLVEKARKSARLEGRDLVRGAACATPYDWEAPESGGEYKVTVIDLGVKFNILRSLKRTGCAARIVPPDISAEEILKGRPDGVLVSNGPGDPEGIPYVAETVKKIIGRVPLFGICMGQHMLTMALGGKMYKLKFGHHGGNHPVRDIKTGKIYISVQNHGFCCDIDSLDGNKVEVTHINLNDGSLEGIRHRDYPLFSVQFHPEAGPGPHDTAYMFDEFAELMKACRK